MPWYAYFEKSTGRLRAQGAADDPIPDGWDRKTFDSRPEGFDWNPATCDFDAPLPVQVDPIKAIEFMRRFTFAERTAIRAARTSDPAVDDFFDLLVVAGTVHVNDPDMIAGVNYLVSVNLIAADRVAVLLSGDG